jgi:hypothetical protein
MDFKYAYDETDHEFSKNFAVLGVFCGTFHSPVECNLIDFLHNPIMTDPGQHALQI